MARSNPVYIANRTHHLTTEDKPDPIRVLLAAHKAFLRISVRLVSCDIRSALKLSKTLGIYAYDAYFLVSAQRLDCPLITLDRRMRQVAQELGIALLESEQ